MNEPTTKRMDEFFDKLKEQCARYLVSNGSSIGGKTPRQKAISDERRAYAYAIGCIKNKVDELDRIY